MDSQIQNAIEVAWDPTQTQNLKAQAFEFLNQLRNDPTAWQVCLSLFTRTLQVPEVVRLVSLELVNHALQNQQIDEQSLGFLKDNLLQYAQRVYGPSGAPDQIDTPSLQNKLTQTLTSVFIYSYKQNWQSFIDDFLALTSSSSNSTRDSLTGTILYLRILGSIHDEIADVLLSRSGQQQKRNNELKDLLRERDVPKIAASWLEILTYWEGKNDSILEMCLKVIGRWVNWVDISLVVNHNALGILLRFVGRTSEAGNEDRVRDAAINCLTETVGKKMKTSDKMEMILFLNLGSIISQLSASPALSDFRHQPEYDTDLAEAVAKLVNTAMNDIVRALEDSSGDPSVRARADGLLQEFVPLLLRFFSDEYDEVCSTVIPSLTDLFTLFRKAQPLPDAYRNMLPPILDAIMVKMRYDETADWDDDDDIADETEFQELRKRLQVLQKNVAAVDQDLYIEFLTTLVGKTFQAIEQRGAQTDWRDVDLALHEMYLFGELAVPNGGLYAKSQPSSVAAERLVAMMTKMIDSGIASFNHPAIQLQYMEIIVRYCSFFEVHTQLIPQTLEAFVRLVHSEHPKIRTRSWYLFFRFVKHLRALIGNVAETVIGSISDLLPIKAELPSENADDSMSDESEHTVDTKFSGQLYLFEAIGWLVTTSSTPVDKQVLYARTLMNPLFADMEQALPRARTGDAQAILQIHHLIMALGTLAHGFSDWVPGKTAAQHKPPPDAVAQEFNRAAEAILIALESLKTSIDIRTAARAAFSRIIGVVGAGILPTLPRWIDGLLTQKSSKEEMSMFLRLLGQVVFGFKSEIYSVLDSLLAPLLQRVLAAFVQPVVGTDDEIQLGELRREYLTFIQVILNNDLGAVLVSETNQGFFETLILSITTLAKMIDNAVASRLAFLVLTRMTQLWGGPDIVTPSTKPIATGLAPSPAFPGFDQFLIQTFNPVCWDVLRNPAFRPYIDAQTKQVLNEIAQLEQTIYCKTGSLFVDHLQQSYFPSLGFDGTEFIRYMTTSEDKKSFALYLNTFLKQRG